jgi:hypothetical protein
MAMLESEENLTLKALNLATQAWVEQEYHRTVHSEIQATPLDRYLQGPSVGRPSPSAEDLARAFRLKVTRRQRRSECAREGAHIARCKSVSGQAKTP